jgi:hypothetical protein
MALKMMARHFDALDPISEGIVLILRRRFRTISFS